ncbi:MAG: hypothetical protein ABIJ12_10490 [bacterium]
MMKIKYFVICIILITACATHAQITDPVNKADSVPPEQFGLNHLYEYLNLKPSDISFRNDYTELDSFRLEIVANIMENPIGMIDYAQAIKKAYVSRQPEVLASILYQDLKDDGQTIRKGAYSPDVNEIKQHYNLYYTDFDLNQLLTQASVYLETVFPNSTDTMLYYMLQSQRKFLINEFKELVVVHEEEEFFSIEESDSLENVEEGYTEEFAAFGDWIDEDPIVKAGIDCLQQLMVGIRQIQKEIENGKSVEKIMTNTGFMPDQATAEQYLGMQPGWKIGGTGNDYYEGDYSFILDFGGDDVYHLDYNPEKPHGVIIIDLSGDDTYKAESDFALGSGCLSVGILLDFEGNDRYDAQSFGLGSGYFGFGILYDALGDDRYDGDTHVQGAGTFGMGLLIDEDGRDIYNAALYSQGFGFIEGMGAIYDIKGSDSYYAGGKYKDVLRYDEHYLSLSQGFGYGLRPYASGGIGVIVDLSGNDSYYSDIFAQGTSYWWSLGIIYDSSGNDNYQSYQYAQGAATHMSLGILVDDYGDDVYFGKGLMQGCGHDYSCGILLDRHGDDTYTAFDLSQAAGSANGIGALIDNEGDDHYFVKTKTNTHGYGNPRRSFGSIGLFIDLGGTDQYTGYGDNNYYWKTPSKWGGGMDIELYPPDSTKTGDQ